MSNLVTRIGIEMLASKKRQGEMLPDGWKSDVRLYFHRKVEFIKRANHVPDPSWFRHFINCYDDVTFLLELDIKEYEGVRNCFERFLQLLNENFMLMLGKIKESEDNARTTNFS